MAIWQKKRRTGWPGIAWRRFWAVLGLGLVLATALPAQQESDEGFLARTLQNFLSEAGREVSIRGFQGALSSRASMDQLSIADDEGVWLVLNDVVLDWNRSALLARRIEVNELSAREIELIRLPATEEDSALPSTTARSGFSLPELPVSVQIGALQAARVVLGAAVLGEPAVFRLDGGAQLVAGQGNGHFTAERTDGQEGLFRFEGGFDNATRQLALHLDLREGEEGIAATLLDIPDRPALAFEIEGEGPVEAFEADIRLETDGQERVTGYVVFTDRTPEAGLLEGVHLELDIAGDLRPLLNTELHPFFGRDSRLRAQVERAEDGRLSLPELTFNTRTLRLAGRVELGADGMPEIVDLIADIAREDGQPVALPGSGGNMTLQEAALNIEFDASRSRDWIILAGIETLAMPDLRLERIDLEAAGRLGPVEGNGNDAANNGLAPLFDGAFDFAIRGIEAADPALQQALGSEISGFMSLLLPEPGAPIEVSGLGIEGQTAQLTAYGQIDGTGFDGFIEAEAPDLTAFSGLADRALAGRAFFQTRGQINVLTGAFDLRLDLSGRDLQVDQTEIDALIAGRSTISADIARDTEGTLLRRLQLTAGVLQMEASGRLNPQDTALEIRFDSADLAVLGQGYGGRVLVEADFGSDGENHRLRLEGQANDLQPGPMPGGDALAALLRGETQLRVDVLQRDGRIDLREARIDGTQLQMALAGVQSADLTDLALELTRLDLAGLRPGAAGRVAGQARLQGDDEGHVLSLDMAANGALRVGIPELDNLLGSGTRLEGVIERGADGALELRTLRLDGQGLDLTVSGQQMADGAADFTLSGRVNNLARALAGYDGAGTVEARVRRAAQAAGYEVNFALTGPSGLGLTGEGRVSDDLQLALRLAGQVDAAIANPRIEPFSVQGPLRLDARIDGPPALSSLRGTATVEGGRFVAPRDGLAFEGISARAELMGAFARVSVDGTSLRGGQVGLEGTIALDSRRDTDISVSANRLVITRPGLFETEITGQARLAGPLALGPRLTGAFDVAQAEIRIPNSPLGRSGFIPDGIRHVGEPTASRRTRSHAGLTREAGAANGGMVPITLDLTLSAPGRVFIRGRGLDAELGGQLHLGGTTRDVIPSGNFGLIRGRLDLLGNRFQLTDGSASMVGSFMPFVRLVASTESSGVVTSIILEGVADSPEITFASIPELPEDEVLARLIFRRSLASLSPFQAAQLALSVATLTGHAESSFLGRTRESLGLDDLDVTTDAEGNTAVRAGRYISENIYTDLSVDSAGRGEVSINLDLTPSVTLRGRADSEGRSGVGVFFERDY